MQVLSDHVFEEFTPFSQACEQYGFPKTGAASTRNRVASPAQTEQQETKPDIQLLEQEKLSLVIKINRGNSKEPEDE